MPGCSIGERHDFLREGKRNLSIFPDFECFCVFISLTLNLSLGSILQLNSEHTKDLSLLNRYSKKVE